eukprot:s217_g14.t2
MLHKVNEERRDTSRGCTAADPRGIPRLEPTALRSSAAADRMKVVIVTRQRTSTVAVSESLTPGSCFRTPAVPRVASPSRVAGSRVPMAPQERRRDPSDGAMYTYDEAFTYYRSLRYKPEVINAYWDHEMLPSKTARNAPAAKAKPKAKAKAQATPEVKSKAKPKEKPKEKPKAKATPEPKAKGKGLENP